MSKCIVGRPCPSEVFEGMDNDACNRCQPSLRTMPTNRYSINTPQMKSHECKTVEGIPDMITFAICETKNVQEIPKMIKD